MFDPEDVMLLSAQSGAVIDVDGVSRPRCNADGYVIHDTDTGIRNFWRWFGDSRLVDDQGRPRVFHHGTDSDFDVFAYGEEGFHVGERAQARTRGHRVLPLYLAARSSLVFEADLGNWNDVEAVADYLLARGLLHKSERADFGGLQDWLLSRGYDSYCYPNAYEGGGLSWAVLDPDQIKSATDNTGAFDPYAASMRDGHPTPRWQAETLARLRMSADPTCGAAEAVAELAAFALSPRHQAERVMASRMFADATCGAALALEEVAGVAHDDHDPCWADFTTEWSVSARALSSGAAPEA